MKNPQKRNLLLILVSYLAFISLGLPDGLLGISWPFLIGSALLPGFAGLLTHHFGWEVIPVLYLLEAILLLTLYLVSSRISQQVYGKVTM
jgi:hypothetical protein